MCTCRQKEWFSMGEHGFGNLKLSSNTIFIWSKEAPYIYESSMWTSKYLDDTYLGQGLISRKETPLPNIVIINPTMCKPVHIKEPFIQLPLQRRELYSYDKNSFRWQVLLNHAHVHSLDKSFKFFIKDMRPLVHYLNIFRCWISVLPMLYRILKAAWGKIG